MNTHVTQPSTRLSQAVAWLVAGLIACLGGTLSWLLSATLFVGGALVVHLLALDVPGWIGWLALLGAPLGAWAEIQLVSV